MATKSAPETNAAPAPQSSGGQLRLVIDVSPPASQNRDADRSPWRLDEETKAIGRQGLARAREVLRAARPAHFEPAA